MAWANSTRRSRLPADWAKRRAAVKRRAGERCEGISLHGEPRWHVDDCLGIGTDCDHDNRGDDHSLSNLRWLSSECHEAKTKAENATRTNRRAAERHPGLLG
jgi:5-methylcytosine-specific restriction protein A